MKARFAPGGPQVCTASTPQCRLAFAHRYPLVRPDGAGRRVGAARGGDASMCGSCLQRYAVGRESRRRVCDSSVDVGSGRLAGVNAAAFAQHRSDVRRGPGRGPRCARWVPTLFGSAQARRTADLRSDPATQPASTDPAAAISLAEIELVGLA